MAGGVGDLSEGVELSLEVATLLVVATVLLLEVLFVQLEKACENEGLELTGGEATPAFGRGRFSLSVLGDCLAVATLDTDSFLSCPRAEDAADAVDVEDDDEEPRRLILH